MHFVSENEVVDCKFSSSATDVEVGKLQEITKDVEIDNHFGVSDITDKSVLRQA